MNWKDTLASAEFIVALLSSLFVVGMVTDPKLNNSLPPGNQLIVEAVFGFCILLWGFYIVLRKEGWKDD